MYVFAGFIYIAEINGKIANEPKEAMNVDQTMKTHYVNLKHCQVMLTVRDPFQLGGCY